MATIREDNDKVFHLLGNYLNYCPDFITEKEIKEMVSTGVSYEYAFSIILATYFELDIISNPADKEFFNHYFTKMIHHLHVTDYMSDPYYKNIKIPTAKIGKSELKYEKFKPFEGFVYKDVLVTKEGRQIPQIGFFDEEFCFPAILENGRIWMTITPNEIETMKEPIQKAAGRVLTYGLGLGYFAYMVSEKEQVESVTVIEKNKDVIQLFNKFILPQFRHREKIHIIHEDAFAYAKKEMGKENYDFVFTDLWHDVSDGLDMYLKMKQYEKYCPHTEFSYWIEKTILCYL